MHCWDNGDFILSSKNPISVDSKSSGENNILLF